MFSQASKDATKQIVGTLVASDTPFTAWEVTLLVRRQADPHVEHFEVKRAVHEAFANGEMGSFTRTLVPIATPNPWAYHPAHVDAIAHYANPQPIVLPATVLSALSSLSPPAPVVAPSISSVAVPTPQTVQKTVPVGANCVYVPTYLVKGINLSVGSEAFVVVDAIANKVKVCNDANGHKISVDLNGNIRVNMNHLKDAGILKNDIVCAIVADHIEISAN